MKKIVDISHYQIVTDWKKFAKDVDYVICKATQGTTYVDPTFAAKKKAARDNGISFGSYHFANGTDAIKEAKFYLKTVGKLQEDDLLCLDYEIHLTDPVTWCKTFLDYCRDNSGVRPLLYINSSTKKGFDWSRAKNYGIWEANYGVNDGKTHPIEMPYVLHQFTSNGTVAGISTRVDLSDTYMSLGGLKEYGYHEAPQAVLTTPILPKKQVIIPVVETPSASQIEQTPTSNTWTATTETGEMSPKQAPILEQNNIWISLLNMLLNIFKK